MRSYFSLVIATLAINTDLFAAEAGMPQLDPKYWASQAFWLILIFIILYISIAKFYLPKIKNNLDDRENKIKDDIEDANKFKELSESKFKEYEKILAGAKKEVIKIQVESKNILDKDIQSKKEAMEKEIENEISKAQKEIDQLKRSSLKDIQNISEYITSSIILQLLTVVIPRLQKLQEEGESGRKVITQWTRYVTVVLALLQSTGLTYIFSRGSLTGGISLIPNYTPSRVGLIVLTMTAGTAFIMWLGELISQRGIGNGMSLIIFESIISQLPASIGGAYQVTAGQGRIGQDRIV